VDLSWLVGSAAAAVVYLALRPGRTRTFDTTGSELA
jgi:hypothetical protein